MMYDAISQTIRGGEADETLPDWTIDALNDVIDGRSGVLGVRHPLGFVCLPLERSGDQGVCVHVWSDRLARAMPTTSATHAHSWDLVSYVLYGSVRNELISVEDAAAEPTHRLFEVHSDTDGDELRRTGRLVRRQGRTGESHRQGEVYTLPAGVFHETVADGEAATIALGQGRAGAVDQALGAFDTATHRIRRQLYDEDETAHAARLVLERLTAERPEPEPRDREDRCVGR